MTLEAGINYLAHFMSFGSSGIKNEGNYELYYFSQLAR